jgi:hypothetical protein
MNQRITIRSPKAAAMENLHFFSFTARKIGGETANDTAKKHSDMYNNMKK